MLKPYLKQVPTMIVIGVAGFASWPTLFPERAPTPPKAASKPPSTAKGGPSLVGASNRDPFQVAGAAKVTASVATTSAVQASAPKAEKPAALAEIPAEEDKVLNGMRLGGTFVGGREQIAIIDGKVYARGESLRKADGSPLPYVVSEVRKDRAVLRRGRRDFVLAFSDAPRKAAKAEAGGVAKAETPARGQPSTPKPEVASRSEPPLRGKRGPSSNRDDGGNPASMLLKLLSGLGGGPASGPLAGLGQAVGLGSVPAGTEVNPTTIQAGIEALSGKFDNIGRAGDTSGAAGGTTP